MAVLQMERDTWDQAGLNLIRVADNLAVVGKSARSALPFDAFGLMCSPVLLPIYQIVESAASGMLDSAQAGLERAGKALRVGAQTLEETAEDQARAFARIQDEMGGVW